MKKIIFVTAKSNPLLFAYCMKMANKFCYDNKDKKSYNDIYSRHENICLCGKVYGHFITRFTDDFKPSCRYVDKIFCKF